MPRIDGPRLNRVRILLWTAVAMVSAAAAVAALILWRDPPRGAGVAEDYASAFGGPFSLVDPQGRTITEQSLRGKPFAIFFGFTHCPDVCPTTLAELAKAQAQWRSLPAATRPALLFVSVDPDRDTPEGVAEYARFFAPDTLAVAPREPQLAAFAQDLGLVYMKVPGKGDDYEMDHSATLILLDPQGRQAGLIRPPFRWADIAADLATLANTRR